MITNIVIKKINRAIFSPFKPVHVVIGFYDEQGIEQATQLVSASLFESDAVEGQAINFKTNQPAPLYEIKNQRDF